ncbi:MAG: hypothetical protein LBS84_11775, partial [Clostridiales bacterium]|nr:hypothetical protein [Clostridiales bacterium]
PTSDAPEVFPQILASLEFDSSVGIYDFEEGQHRSYIRTQRILIKGDRGVIDDKRVKYLPDCKTAMESEITRHDRGHDENCEGVGLKGFTACGEWVYTPRFTNARLNDDEIAAAECMARMNEYINGASPFYSFAEAAQDAYLGMLITRASESGEVVKAEAQPWAENLKIHNDMREINPPN